MKSEDTAVQAADDVDDTAAAAGDYTSEEQSKLHSGVNDMFLQDAIRCLDFGLGLGLGSR